MRRAALPLAGLVLLGAMACARVSTDRDVVRAAIDRTERVTRSFVYADRSGGVTTTVSGSVADDYRYRLDATVGGAPAASEVVLDDQRALRVTQAALLHGLAPGGATVPADLTQGHWVVDARGAAALSPKPAVLYRPGSDPLYDAIDALEYTRTAMNQVDPQAVQLFNPQSSSYRPAFDPFPKPGPGVRRYDFVPPVLSASSQQLTRAVQPPATRFFRRMSVYIQGGLIVEIREQISVLSILQDPQSHLATRIGDYGIKPPPDASLQSQAAYITATLQRLEEQDGLPPLRPRTLDVTFSSFGGSATVALPQGAVAASLTGIGDHGQVLYEQGD